MRAPLTICTAEGGPVIRRRGGLAPGFPTQRHETAGGDAWTW